MGRLSAKDKMEFFGPWRLLFGLVTAYITRMSSSASVACKQIGVHRMDCGSIYFCIIIPEETTTYL
jgi:hypothetical protein